jgi:hypothetical protein
MRPGEIIQNMPYPIARVYADLENATSSLQEKREALYFTVYQLMRTVGLTLVGQYLTRGVPADAGYQARDRLNKAIARIRCPFFSDWITLLNTLRRYGEELKLDFFPEFPDAMQKVRQSRVEVPREYGLDYGFRWQNLNWLDAFLALRNGCAHAGMSRDHICSRDIEHFRPILDDLLEAFAFLTSYDLLVLRSPLEEDQPMVQIMRGAVPPEPEPTELDDRLYEAFDFSPVVMRAHDGRVQGLFPLFHAHIMGEPLHCYDGHNLSEDPLRRTIYYLGTEMRLPVHDEDAFEFVQPPAPPNAGDRMLALLKERQITWRLERDQVSPWTIRDVVRDNSQRTLNSLTSSTYLHACYLDRPELSKPLWDFLNGTTHRAFLLSGRAGCGKPPSRAISLGACWRRGQTFLPSLYPVAVLSRAWKVPTSSWPIS